MRTGMSVAFSKGLPTVICAALYVACSAAMPTKKPQPDHPYRYSVLDVPVSLAGTVKTPPFTVPKTQYYWIMVQSVNGGNFGNLVCEMSMREISSSGDTCPRRLLKVNWTAWNGDTKIDSGISSDQADSKYTAQYVFKFLGAFRAKRGEYYTVEAHFLKDASSLDAGDPHLIVVGVGSE